MLVVSVALLLPLVLGDIPVLPITEFEPALVYDAQTDTISEPDYTGFSWGRVVWQTTYFYPYDFLGMSTDNAVLDWGDVFGRTTVGSLRIGECTNSQAADGDNTIVFALNVDDNGWNSQFRRLLAAYEIRNIPGSSYPMNEYWGRAILLHAAPPYFTITGADLDEDGLTDFCCLNYFSSIRTPGAVAGTLIAGPEGPNGWGLSYCPGIEDAYDLFGAPDLENDPNLANLEYLGSYDFGGDPFAQFYMSLHSPQCPNRGPSSHYCTADVGNYNCIVDLADLAEMLSWYGTVTDGHHFCAIYPPTSCRLRGTDASISTIWPNCWHSTVMIAIDGIATG